jgi:hypothetical protein
MQGKESHAGRASATRHEVHLPVPTKHRLSSRDQPSNGIIVKIRKLGLQQNDFNALTQPLYERTFGPYPKLQVISKLLAFTGRILRSTSFQNLQRQGQVYGWKCLINHRC